MYEALWSPSYDPMWSLTLARLGRAGGAEKYSSPAGKPFFDIIDPFRKSPVTPPRHGATRITLPDFSVSWAMRSAYSAPLIFRPVSGSLHDWPPAFDI